MARDKVKELVACIGTSLVEYGNAFLLIRSTEGGPEVECLAPGRVRIDGKLLEVRAIEMPETYTKVRIQAIRRTVVNLHEYLGESWRREYHTEYGEVLEFLSAMEDRAPEA